MTVLGDFSLGFYAIDELPDDEWSALISMQEGMLDSATWELLQQYYYYPLSVPHGELSLLKEIIPDFPSAIPTMPSQLRSYEPWTLENIQTFFRDYPYLNRYRPILTFENSRQPSYAQIGCMTRGYGADQSFRQIVRCNTAGNKLRTQVSLSFTDKSVRWYRRSALISLPALGKITIGNFSYTMNKGLFYGYFPSSSGLLHKRCDFFHGYARAWNGICAQIPLKNDAVVFNTLFHTRQSESVVGLRCDVKPSSLFSFYGAFSAAVYNERNGISDSACSFHGGIHFSSDYLDISLESGSHVCKPAIIPIFFQMKNQRKENAHTLSFVRIPSGFHAPRSSIRTAFLNRLGLSDSCVSDILCLDFSLLHTRRIFNHFFTASYLTEKNIANLRTSIKTFILQPLPLSLKYSMSVVCPADKVRHTIKCVCDYNAWGFILLSPSVSLIVEETALKSVSALYSELNVLPNMTFAADMKCIFNKERKKAVSITLKQRLNLFEKTYGEIGISLPMTHYYHEKYMFYAKSNFIY